MKNKRGYRALRVVLFAAALLPHMVSAQVAATPSAAAADGKFHVKGVLISDRGRSALVNGRLVRENERIGDAEVVEISEHDVRLRRGGYDLTVLVGGSSSWSHANPIQQHAAVNPPADLASRDNDSDQHHIVASGETLSGIAERHVAPGGTLVGTMRAIFEANPQAFYGDMHSLRAGVALRLPETTGANPDTRVAENLGEKASAPSVYGPVREGESLSAIAAKLADARYTVDQLMTALFVKNPQAFGDNINLLYAGAELRLPDALEIARRTPGAAAAVIAHHMTAWNERTRAPRLQASLTSVRRTPLP